MNNYFQMRSVWDRNSEVFKFAGAHEYGTECVQALPDIGILRERPDCTSNLESVSRIQRIRDMFSQRDIEAYIVFAEDVHQNLYTSDHDKRLLAISGFPGIIGTAVITRDKLGMWTDGRSFNKAAETVDCDWFLYRKGSSDAPTVTTWIKDELSSRGEVAVGISPFHISSDYWKNLKHSFVGTNIRLKAIIPDLVDVVWTDGRPPQISVSINALPTEFSGKRWQDKITDVHREMDKVNVDIMLISKLDEIPWLFNMRAVDFGFSPFFYSFAIVDRLRKLTRLYIIDHVERLRQEPTDPEIHITLAEHLHFHRRTCTGNNCPRTQTTKRQSGSQQKTTQTTRKRGGNQQRTSSLYSGSPIVEVYEYSVSKVADVLFDLARRRSTRKVWISPDVSYEFYSAVPKDKIYQAHTPVAMHKSVKNPTEIKGMEDSNLLDSAAMAVFYARLEKEVKSGEKWTVFSAAQEAKNCRRRIPYYRGLSFGVLSGSGPSAAHIDNIPPVRESRTLTTSEMFLQDSGGQYLNSATSDLCRTLHFGTPTDEDKEKYTRVLMAHVNLAKLVWIKGRHGHELDAIARQPLWDIGHDFPHQTGHMIGAFGEVVEGPGKISSTYASFDSEVPPQAGIFTNEEYIYQPPDWSLHPIEKDNFITIEPGFYEVGKTGVRIENTFHVVEKSNLMYQNLTECEFLGFESVTFIPYEPHLINVNMLSPSQIEWINNYHTEVRNKILPILSSWNETEASEWVKIRTGPLML